MGRVDFQRWERAEEALGSVAENGGPGACRACGLADFVHATKA